MRTKTIALRTRLLGSGGTASGVLGGIGSIHNVCHSLCVTVVSTLAIFGITTSILPLMFLQTYQIYFWSGALIFTGASYYFYQNQRNKIARDRNLLFINAGLLIFGLPAEALAKAGLPFPLFTDYMDFFRFFGGSLALIGFFLLIFSKKFKTVYGPVRLGGVHPNFAKAASFAEVASATKAESLGESATPEVRPHVNQSSNPAASTTQLPKLTMSSALFSLVVGGFLVNQYLMYRMGVFDQMASSVGSTVGSTTTSLMKSQSRMKLTLFDTALAKERMDKNNDGVCDVCGMKIEQCIDSGQIDCNMGNNKDAIGVLGSQHIHADFKVYVNGQVLDFSDKDHMGRMRNNLPVSSFIHVDSGAPLPEKTGDVLHMHATKVPLSLFFRSLGMNLTKDSLALTDGRILKNENGNTLKFYLNGHKVDDLDNYVFQDLDKLLISFGPKNDPDIEGQFSSITDFAKSH